MSTLESRIAAKDRGQGLAGTGVVAIWNGIRDDLREDFFEWHPREHMVERLSIPGFLRGRRCIALDGSTEFLTIYELRVASRLRFEAKGEDESPHRVALREQDAARAARVVGESGQRVR